VKKPLPRWYRMDSAAILYSSLQSERYSSTYRFSAQMTERVDPEALQRAIDLVMPRFPGFAMRIRRGFFWHYLEPNQAPGPFLREDVSDPCQPFRFQGDNHWLIRFYYFDRRISIELFHALSDGAGALVFFRALLAAYLRERGCDIPAGGDLPDLAAPPPPREREDAYSRYAGARTLHEPKKPRAFPNTGTPEPFYTFHVTMGFVPAGQLRALARKNGASVTEYLAAVLIQVILERQERLRPARLRPVTLAVPVNLRAFFPTETLGNFITTVAPFVDPRLGDYDFAEILAQVRAYMKLHVNRQELRAAFTGNVRLTRNPILRVIPLAFKTPIMALSYRLRAVRPYSCTLTNPGVFTVPDEMRPHIARMEVVLGQATVPRCHCAAITYGDTTGITFAGALAETDTERAFFRYLVRQGLPVRIESNR